MKTDLEIVIEDLKKHPALRGAPDALFEGMIILIGAWIVSGSMSPDVVTKAGGALFRIVAEIAGAETELVDNDGPD